jgi:HAD superfamily hydrolase (TIGR01509 family)
MPESVNWKNKKAIIFDMDGVLIDSEPFYLGRFQKFFEDHGQSFTEELRIKLAGAATKMMWEIVHDAWDGSLTAEEIEQLYISEVKEKRPDYNELLFPKVFEVLDILQSQNYRLALASSSGSRTIEIVLATTGLGKYFSTVVSGTMFTQSKPDPEIYLHTLELLELQAEECIAIEDSTYGIQSALAAGLEVAAIRDDRFGYDQHLANCILDRLEDLLPLLGIN